MSTVERLLKATEEIWAGYHEKPFVRGLGDGTLDVKKFRRYIIQDYWYLMDYTKVFAGRRGRGAHCHLLLRVQL